VTGSGGAGSSQVTVARMRGLAAWFGRRLAAHRVFVDYGLASSMFSITGMVAGKPLKEITGRMAGADTAWRI